MTAWRSRPLLALALFASASVAAPPATASPRSDPTTGRTVFTGATVAHPTSITLNPAALGRDDKSATTIYVALTSVLQQLDLQRREHDLATGTLVDGARIDDTQVLPGGQLAVVWHTSPRLTLGFEARLPVPEMYADGHDELRYHVRGGGTRDYVASAAVALRLSGRVFVGASVSHANTFLTLRYARDTALEAGSAGLASDCGGSPCGLGNALATELYDLDVRSAWISTSNLRVNVGTVVRVMKGVWVGVGYHTPPGLGIQTSLDGTVAVRRAPRDGGDLLEGGSTVNLSLPASIDAEIRAALPGSLELALGGRWEDLSRNRAYDVRVYNSRFRAAGIPEWQARPRGFDDAFAMWAGVEQVGLGDDQPWGFGARIGFETASVTTARTSPMAIGPTSVTLDLGAQLRLRQWTLQLSYGVRYLPDVNVESSAYDPQDRIDCLDGGLDYTTPACAAVRGGYAISTAAGDYRQLEHALRLGFQYAFP